MPETETWVWTLLIASLILGIIPASIAQNKGKDFLAWYFYGVLLFFFAMIHAIVLPEQTDPAKPTMQDIREARVPLKNVATTSIYEQPLLLDPNCPVDVLSYNVSALQDTEAVYADIKLMNLASKNIVAVKLRLDCYDAFNEPVTRNGDNTIVKKIQDLDVSPREHFAENTLIDLQDLKDTRKIQVVVMGVLYSDNSQWVLSEENLVEIETALLEGEELENLKEVAGKDAICYARRAQEYWQCVCGRVNELASKDCLRCNRKQGVVLTYYPNKIHIDEELELLQNKKAKEKLVREKQLITWRKRLLVIALLLVAGVGIFYLTYTAPLDADYYIDYSSGTIPIGDLPIGARVVDPSWEWEFCTGRNYTRESGDETRPVTWIVVAKDHYEGLEPHVTLLSEALIGRFIFDNSTDRGSSWGSNHWGESGTGTATRGLRPWLNSTGIHAGEGFYRAFSESFKRAVLTTTVPNREWEYGGAYSTGDLVFMPSITELNDEGHHRTYPIGRVYAYFAGAVDEERVARLGGDARWYWTRSPDSHYGNRVRYVGPAGAFDVLRADSDGCGVRPALNLKSDILVSEITP